MNVDVCRLCSKCDGTLLDVFNNDLDQELCNKIGVCFGILITRDDHITKKVCKQCYFLTNSYSELRASAINNDTKLKKDYEDRLKTEVKKPENNNVQTASRIVSSVSKVTPPKNPKNSSNEKENRTNIKEKTIKQKTPSPNENKILLKPKDNNKLINTTNKESPITNNEPVVIENRQTSFLNTLPGSNPIELKPKKSYHSSINKIKSIYPGIRIPRKYWHLNFDPLIDVTRIPENEVNKYNSNHLWAVNVNTNKKPGLYLKRISRNDDKESDFEMESDASETSKRSELHVNCETRSESSFCASPTPERDLFNKKKKNRAWGELSPSDLNNILDNRNRSCKLTGKNVYTEEVDEDDFDDRPVKRTRYSSKESDKNEKTNYEVQSITDDIKYLNEVSFMNGGDNLLLFDTNKVCKTFICQTCSQLFDTPKSLKEHQKLHSKNTLRCFKCSKSFPIVEDLIQHNLSVHSKDSSSDDSNNSSGLLTVTDEVPTPPSTSYVAKKSTCHAAKIIESQSMPTLVDNFIPEPITSDVNVENVLNTVVPNINQNTNQNTTKIIDEVVDLSSDDDCEFISLENRNLSSPISLIENKKLQNTKLSPILQRFLTDKGKSIPKIDTIQLDTAIKSITPNVLGNKNSSETLETTETPKSFADISKENRLTSVNICDEEYYLKYVFEKNIKVQKLPDTYSSYVCKKQEDIRMWYLRDMEKLLEKSFIPVEFIPGNCNGVILKYSYSGNKRMKPKSTTYKWSALNAVDIPKNNVEFRKNNTEHTSSTVLSTNGEIYTIPTNMEIVGVTQAANETTNSLVLQTSGNVKVTNTYNPASSLSAHLRNIAPKSAPNIGQSTNIKEFNKNNNTGLSNNKSLPMNSTIGEKFIAKVLPDGSLTLVPTNSLTSVHNPSLGSNKLQPVRNQPSTSSSSLNVVNNQPSTSSGSNRLQSQNVQKPPVGPVQTLKDLNLFSNQSVIQNQTPVMSNDSVHSLYTPMDQGNVQIQNFVSLSIPPPDAIPQPASIPQISSPLTNGTPSISPPPLQQIQSKVSSSSSANMNASNDSTNSSNVTKPLLRIKNLSELTEKPIDTSNNHRYNLQSMYVQTLTNYVNSCSNTTLAANMVENNTDNEYLQIS